MLTVAEVQRIIIAVAELEEKAALKDFGGPLSHARLEAVAAGSALKRLQRQVRYLTASAPSRGFNDEKL